MRIERFLHFTFGILHLTVSIFVAWLLLSQVNFFYSFWHQQLNIYETIQLYGPQNTTRPNFHHTDKSEQARLFKALVSAIHHNGEGLDKINYVVAGKDLGPLLTQAEITHLQDVATLIERAKKIVGCALALWSLILVCMVWWKIRPPTLKHTSLLLLTGVIINIGIVLIVGPVKIFYAWHTWVFPADHQWFFYYQDSLMSMLMQAPNLFGPIGVSWLLLSLIVYASLQGLLTAVINRLPN